MFKWWILLYAFALTNCGYQKEDLHFDGQNVNIQTTNKPNPTFNPSTGDILYINSDQLRTRFTPEVRIDNIVGVMEPNDEVEFIERVPDTDFFKVKVKSSRGVSLHSEVFIPYQSVSINKRNLTPSEKAMRKYFMVENIATEILRVYEKCSDETNAQCDNKLIFQTEMVVGENGEGTRSNVGTYLLSYWSKFYEDFKHNYPAWYHPDYPPVPGPGSNNWKWLSRDVMPKGRGSIRGAFGWYTGFLSPNADYQWTHGTLGWGPDGDKFITFKDTSLAQFLDFFTAIRSHGCSRIENRAVAYLRHLLPIGTTVLKVYAQETLRFPSLDGYSKVKPKWPYILTTVDYGQPDGQSADEATVLTAKTPESQWLERGVYEIDQYPKMSLKNVYQINNSIFRSGIFFVDTGNFLNYRHPPGVPQGGNGELALPDFAEAR